jgi:hypothetical protein
MRYSDLIDEGVQFTRADLEKAIEMNKAGVTVPQIALRMGVKPNSLKQTLHKFKKGLWKGENEKLKVERAKIDQMVADGMSGPDMAREMKTTYMNMYTRLWKMGYDREVRDEYKNGEIVGIHQ